MNRFGSATSLLLAALGLTSAWTPSAHAAEAHANAPASYPQIHLDVSPAGSAVVPLLQAELDELGLTVVEGPASAPSITIHAVLTRDSLEVRISDDATGDTVLREVFSVANGRSMDPRTAVLHASELLRWHLHYQTPAAPRAEPARPEAPQPAPQPPTERRAELRLGLLPLALYAPGGMQLGLGAQLELSRNWRFFGLRALGASSLVPNRMSVPEGQLEARATWVGLSGSFRWEPGEHGTSLKAGLGGALFTSALRGSVGSAASANLGKDDRVLTFAPLVELRAEQRVTRGFTLLLASQCLLPLEALRLHALERQVGRYGKQVLTLGLGLELTLL